MSEFKCKNCGVKIMSFTKHNLFDNFILDCFNWKFCPYCGHKINEPVEIVVKGVKYRKVEG